MINKTGIMTEIWEGLLLKIQPMYSKGTSSTCFSTDFKVWQ